MVCPECNGRGKAIYYVETDRDENTVTVEKREGICRTCYGSGEKPQTNADRIRAMSDEELAKFLKSLVFGRETPWANPFARTYCDKCLPIKAALKETGKEIEFHECECWDGGCPNGDDVTWWLKQPVEEVNRDAE